MGGKAKTFGKKQDSEFCFQGQ